MKELMIGNAAVARGLYEAGCTVVSIGSSQDKAEQARRIFDALRAFDETKVDRIYAQCPGDEGLGLAIANRLKKAAGFQVIEPEACL